MNFENRLIESKFGAIYASRYIASWNKIVGKYKANVTIMYRNTYRGMIAWLESIGVSKEDAVYVANLADNGKLELENDLLKFISPAL